MSSSELNITTYIGDDCKFSSNRTQLLKLRRERSQMTEQQVNNVLRLRGRIALLKGQAAKAREHAATRRDLHSRAMQHQDRATELTALAALLRDRVIDAKDLPVGDEQCNTTHALGTVSATMNDLNHLADVQNCLVQEIQTQLRELNKADKEHVQELQNLHNCFKTPNKEFPSPSGISEYLRRATVKSLETAAVRQVLKALVQEAITRNQVDQDNEERDRRQDLWTSVIQSTSLVWAGN